MAHRIYKIAVVVPKYGLVGGGEKFVLELTERIAASPDYEVHVFAHKWKQQSDRIAFHKVPVISFPKFLTTISFAWFAKRRMASMNFDIIHTHERIFHADIFSMHSVPHGFWVREIRRKRMSLFDYGTRWVERRLINKGKCRAFLPVSGITKEKFLQEFNAEAGRVQVIHPGVDNEKFNQFDRAICRAEIRKRFGFDDEAVILLFVSMNFELKGLDNIMAGVARTKAKFPAAPLKLLVVGKGNVRKYKRLAESLGIGNDIAFAGIWKENIEQVYLAADIFVMLSSFDTFGMAVLEAMAASLPVVISHNVGAKDLVIDGRNGFIVVREDIAALSARIIFLLKKENQKVMGEEAHKVAQGKTWNHTAQQVLQIYHDFTEN